MSCTDTEGVSLGRENHREGKCPKFFPEDIEELLKDLVCECVVLVFENGTREKVRIECVTDELVVVKDQNTFRFIDIDCICSVIVSAETILDNLLGNCE